VLRGETGRTYVGRRRIGHRLVELVERNIDHVEQVALT
jgi:hypothetical protein